MSLTQSLCISESPKCNLIEVCVSQSLKHHLSRVCVSVYSETFFNGDASSYL